MPQIGDRGVRVFRERLPDEAGAGELLAIEA
jgi:hypothetical protein